MALTKDDLTFMSSLLGTTDPNDLTAGMGKKDKQGLMEFINKEPEPTSLSLPEAKGYGKDISAARQQASDLLTPTSSTTKTVAKTRDGSTVPTTKKPDPLTGRDEYVTKLAPEEQKLVASEIQSTQQELQQAAKDPSMFEQVASIFGVVGDQAMKAFEALKTPADRVDWLTMLTVYAASRSQGNNATMAIANGLMRGMESEGKRKQAQAIMQRNAQAAQQQQANKDREFMLDKYKAQSGRMTAQAAVDRAKAQGQDNLLSALSSDERAVADTMVESEKVDSALAYEAANQLKKRNMPVTPMALKKVIEQMVEKGYAEDPLIGSTSLM